MSKKQILSKSNSIKAKSGSEFTKDVETKITSLLKKKLIKSFQTGLNFSHSRFSYEKQYKIDLLIETLDDKFIVVRSTKSLSR